MTVARLLIASTAFCMIAWALVLFVRPGRGAWRLDVAMVLLLLGVALFGLASAL